MAPWLLTLAWTEISGVKRWQWGLCLNCVNYFCLRWWVIQSENSLPVVNFSGKAVFLIWFSRLFTFFTGKKKKKRKSVVFRTVKWIVVVPCQHTYICISSAWVWMFSATAVLHLVLQCFCWHLGLLKHHPRVPYPLLPLHPLTCSINYEFPYTIENIPDHEYVMFWNESLA